MIKFLEFRELIPKYLTSRNRMNAQYRAAKNEKLRPLPKANVQQWTSKKRWRTEIESVLLVDLNKKFDGWHHLNPYLLLYFLSVVKVNRYSFRFLLEFETSTLHIRVSHFGWRTSTFQLACIETDIFRESRPRDIDLDSGFVGFWIRAGFGASYHNSR